MLQACKASKARNMHDNLITNMTRNPVLSLHAKIYNGGIFAPGAAGRKTANRRMKYYLLAYRYPTFA